MISVSSIGAGLEATATRQEDTGTDTWYAFCTIRWVVEAFFAKEMCRVARNTLVILPNFSSRAGVHTSEAEQK